MQVDGSGCLDLGLRLRVTAGYGGEGILFQLLLLLEDMNSNFSLKTEPFNFSRCNSP